MGRRRPGRPAAPAGESVASGPRAAAALGSVVEKGGPTVQPDQSRSPFVTVSEVASQLRVSSMTVYRLVQSGQLPAVRVGRSYRIRADDVDRYLGERFTQAG